MAWLPSGKILSRSAPGPARQEQQGGAFGFTHDDRFRAEKEFIQLSSLMMAPVAY